MTVNYPPILESAIDFLRFFPMNYGRYLDWQIPRQALRIAPIPAAAGYGDFELATFLRARFPGTVRNVGFWHQPLRGVIQINQTEPPHRWRDEAGTEQISTNDGPEINDEFHWGYVDVRLVPRGRELISEILLAYNQNWNVCIETPEISREPEGFLQLVRYSCRSIKVLSLNNRVEGFFICENYAEFPLEVSPRLPDYCQMVGFSQNNRHFIAAITEIVPGEGYGAASPDILTFQISDIAELNPFLNQITDQILVNLGLTREESRSSPNFISATTENPVFNRQINRFMRNRLLLIYSRIPGGDSENERNVISVGVDVTSFTSIRARFDELFLDDTLSQRQLDQTIRTVRRVFSARCGGDYTSTFRCGN